MPLDITNEAGLPCSLDQHAITKMLLQNPAHLKSGIYGPLFLAVSTGTANETIFDANAPKCKVVNVWGVMTGAGATSDTVLVNDGTNAITDTIDVSAKLDTAYFAVGTIDDSKDTIASGGSLKVVRASSASCDIYILLALEA